MGLYFSFDPGAAVASAIKKWSPPVLQKEKEYEKSLYEHLHKEFSDLQVTKQHAVGRTKADILVGGKVIIELKKDLSSTGEYKRLTGQLVEYQKWEGDIVIVLLGKTEPNLRKELEAFVEKNIGDGIFSEARIIDK
jgi:hypothetical protein